MDKHVIAPFFISMRPNSKLIDAMKKIDLILENLGEIIPSLEKEKNVSYNYFSEIDELKNTYLKIDQALIDFLLKYGFCFFVNEIVLTKTIELPPVISKRDPDIPIGMVFGFGNTENSIKLLREHYSNSEFINQDFVPICEGVAGDMIFYSLKEGSFGKIYYWFHEGDYGRDKFLIANDFEDFIKNLDIKKPEVQAVEKEVAMTFVSPKMLKLVNETRIKNGLSPLTAEELLKK